MNGHTPIIRNKSEPLDGWVVVPVTPTEAWIGKLIEDSADEPTLAPVYALTIGLGLTPQGLSMQRAVNPPYCWGSFVSSMTLKTRAGMIPCELMLRAEYDELAALVSNAEQNVMALRAKGAGFHMATAMPGRRG